ncbi:hypothetical protein [Klenkia sp. PcliD-1-E]|uniref:arsenate reductase/protein-tyrosine-phosphatase family protein n=1 Tax=Klenkia sp. PcliD-1-E TaxID=2954492 RepID=UPI00209864A4|nr:hypothetical protein [Klenkia sp. PcliD-1-E]MCO7220236.1 hypothetical protein [Klenkia sp. PcliD-1-E]
MRAGADVHLLFVCTGNVCRSPLAERLTASFASSARIAGLTAESAGTRALVGRGMDPDAAATLRALSGEDDGFRARALLPAMAERADLVLTMQRTHRATVLERTPGAMRRTFTLREAAAVLDLLPAHERPSAATLAERGTELVTALAARRREWRGDLDIRDPYRQDREVHAEVGREIRGALVPVLEALTGVPGVVS